MGRRQPDEVAALTREGAGQRGFCWAEPRESLPVESSRSPVDRTVWSCCYLRRGFVSLISVASQDQNSSGKLTRRGSHA